MFNNRPASSSQEDQESYLVSLREHVLAWLDGIDEEDRELEGNQKLLCYLREFMESGNSYTDMCELYQQVYLAILDIQ